MLVKNEKRRDSRENSSSSVVHCCIVLFKFLRSPALSGADLVRFGESIPYESTNQSPCVSVRVFNFFLFFYKEREHGRLGT